MSNIHRVTISRESGEYHLRAYDFDGNRLPDADYFTPDKDDADATRVAMLIIPSYVNKLDKETQ